QQARPAGPEGHPAPGHRAGPQLPGQGAERVRPGLRPVRRQPAEAGPRARVREQPQAADRRPPDPRPGHRGHPVRVAGAGRGPGRGGGRAADLLQPGGDPGPGRPDRGHPRRPHRGPVPRGRGDHERARPLHDRRPRRRGRGAGGVKVEEKPPPPPEPPEPEAEEAAARLPWGQRLRGWGLQLLAPAGSLLIAAVIGVLVILIVQRSWGEVTDVASSMWSYGLFNRNSVAFILGRATPFIFAGLAVAIAFKA